MNIQINFAKLKHTVITTQKGTKCVVIPIVENEIYEGKDGNLYFSMDCIAIKKENQKTENNFTKTHLVKTKSKQGMTQEEKDSRPILGDVKEYVGSSNNVPVAATSVDSGDFSTNDDLPF